jgi:hypothetical protein
MASPCTHVSAIRSRRLNGRGLSLRARALVSGISLIAVMAAFDQG